MTIKLTALQRVLLTTAAQRPGGSLLSAPESIAGQCARIRKTIPSLLNRKLVEEVDAVGSEAAWREDGERCIGVVITLDGYAAIGVEPPVAPASVAAVPRAPDAVAAKPPTKAAQVVALLQREQGATLVQLAEATGWLPHTTRAALTGLRKKGHAITSDKVGEVRTYRVVGSVAA